MTDARFEELLREYTKALDVWFTGGTDYDSSPTARAALVAYHDERTSERYVVCRIEEMGNESLSPEYHGMLEMVLGMLRVNRRALRGDVPEANFGNTEAPR